MFKAIAKRTAVCGLASIALALMNAGPALAQDKIQARVIGFPVKVEGGGTRLDLTASARLDDRITVQLEPLPGPAQQAAAPTTPAAGNQANTQVAPANQTAGNMSQPASTAGAAPADQNKNLSWADEQSWIPGLTHAQVLKLVPYLNARPLKGLYPETVDPQSHTLTYHLERTDKSQEAWTDLLSNPGFKPREMTFSVGLEDKQQLQSLATLNLVVLPVKWFLVSVALFLIVLYIFFRLARWSSLIRDPGNQSYVPRLSVLWRSPADADKLGQFSLARSQMAFWFFMVISAFVLIWMITGDTGTITQGVLVLIGISAGTALGATAIDSSKHNGANSAAPVKSTGFLNDILSDGTGVSFHRFQIVVWTIVLGFVFARYVLGHLAMPQFDTNLLTLMGISSGTYLGMKLPESSTPKSNGE